MPAISVIQFLLVTGPTGDGGRSRKRTLKAIRIDDGQVGHTLRFDEIALAGQHFHKPEDSIDE